VFGVYRLAFQCVGLHQEAISLSSSCHLLLWIRGSLKIATL
jgi:hypothetical protein